MSRRGWLAPLDKLGADYDVDDLLPAIRSGLSVDGKLYAAPFYGESSFVMYRKDLMDKAGLKMPEPPTWDFIKQAADKMTDKAAGIYGICLRGKAGWGENMAFLTATANSFGARWFDEKWQPQFNSPEWKKTLDFYIDMMKADGPPGASSNGFNENLALFNAGKCGMWIDATVAASMRHRQGLDGRRQGRFRARARTTVSASAATGFGRGRSPCPPARRKPTRRRSSSHGRRTSITPNWWPRKKAGPTFLPERAPRFTRTPTTKAAPFAEMTLDSINSADPTHPTVKPVPYTGVQFVGDPRISGYRVRRRTGLLGGAGRDDDRRRRARQGSGAARNAAMKKAGYIK